MGILRSIQTMIRALLEKWFNLDPRHCETCEVLRSMLDESNKERKDLLARLLDKDKVEPPPTPIEEFKPVGQSFVPWRVRQQMLEQEDRKQAELLRRSAQDIEKLEKELEVNA